MAFRNGKKTCDLCDDGSGGGDLPPATAVGQVLFSVDGSTFTVQQPLTSQQGWLVNNDGILLVSG